MPGFSSPIWFVSSIPSLQTTLPALRTVTQSPPGICPSHAAGGDRKRILLIDDVFTTGTTSNECAKVLHEAGAKQVTVLAPRVPWRPAWCRTAAVRPEPDQTYIRV